MSFFFKISTNYIYLHLPTLLSYLSQRISGWQLLVHVWLMSAHYVLLLLADHTIASTCYFWRALLCESTFVCYFIFIILIQLLYFDYGDFTPIRSLFSTHLFRSAEHLSCLTKHRFWLKPCCLFISTSSTMMQQVTLSNLHTIFWCHTFLTVESFFMRSSLMSVLIWRLSGFILWSINLCSNSWLALVIGNTLSFGSLIIWTTPSATPL